MALRQKFGRLVLLDETDSSGLGREYRAARLGPTGLDRLVNVLCFAPAVSSHGAATKRLMDEARLAARLQNPGLVRVLGIGRVEQTFYVSTELVEGRTLSAILGRCSHDSFPFAADHALMVASRTASALEYLHGKRDDTGRPLFHGMLAPSRLVIAFDGEVKVKGLGLWAALRESDLLPEEDRTRLAPEQREGAGEPRSDVYSLGVVLLEALTGCTPGADPQALLATARMVSVAGEASPLPKPLVELLSRSLEKDPAARFSSMTEMRKAVDTLLFSGDFTPTTFDLAFFMHTLFRDEMEREAKGIEDARRADYHEFIEDKSAPAIPMPAPQPVSAAAAATLLMSPLPDSAAAVPEPAPEAVATQLMAPVPAEAPAPVVLETQPMGATAGQGSPRAGSGAFKGSAVPEPPRPAAVEPPPLEPAVRPARDVAPREVTPRLGAHAEAEPPSRKGLWIALGLVAVVVVGVGAGLFLRSGSGGATSATTTLSPDVVAAMTRVKELEARIAQIEKERADAENKAAEEAKKKLEAAAAAKGRVVDPAALAKAQEEARQRARAEQERKQQEELARLAEARRAEERRIAEASPTPPAVAPVESTAAAVQPTPEAAVATTTTTAPAAAAPAAAPAPAQAEPPAAETPDRQPVVVPPTVVSKMQPTYPVIARMRKIPGTVELTLVVDEAGKVAEVRIVRATPAKLGFEEAATLAAKQWKYKPATRDGQPIRMLVSVSIVFR